MSNLFGGTGGLNPKNLAGDDRREGFLSSPEADLAGLRDRLPSGRVNSPRHDAASEGLRTLAYELTVVEARERGRIARDLHDEVGQFLTLARLKAGELRSCAHQARGLLLDDLCTLLSQAARATRAATFDLSCPVLQLGLQEALESLALRLSRPGGPAMRVDGRVPALAVPETMLTVVYRVVRELALNALKHASATEVWIRPSVDAAGLSITVADDGVGFNPAASTRAFCREGGFGLLSARSQIRAIGGRLDIKSAPGTGTMANVVLALSSG